MDRMTCMLSFVKVVESAGFSAAARRLNLSASIVTGHIKWLEEKLGARLLNRNTRNVSLTDIGHAYYERCVQILAELEDADRIAAEMQSEPRGVLKLDIAPPVAEIIAPVIAEFTATYPAASVQLMITSKMTNMVDQGVDLAIRITPEANSSHIVRRLATYPFVVCGAPQYLANHGRPERPSDLERHNCVVFYESSWNREWRFVSPDSEEVIHPVGNLEANNSTSLRAAAVLGQGLIYMPIFVVADELRSGRLVAVLQDYVPVQLSIDAIYPDRRHLSPKVRCFIDLAAKQLHHPNWMNPIASATSAA
jgi:DNA-binding transcriptional LysR family regulator